MNELVHKDYSGKWTHYWDMHSGGGTKFEPFEHIYVQGEESDLFEEVTGRSPYNVSCECCGEDYSVTTSEDLVQATAYQRNCRYEKDLRGYVEESGYGWREYVPIETYIQQEDVLLIFKDGTTNKDITRRLED